MAYIGTPAAIGFSKTTKDRFSGDNSTTGFTMSQAASTATDIQVFVDNIRQEPTIAYSTSGATLTFTEAPPTGTNNVYVIHQHQALGTGPLPPQDLGSTDYIFGDDISFNSDSAVINFGLDSEIKLAHVHNTGLSLQTDSSQLLFGADNDINLTHVHNTGLTTNGNFSLKSDSSVLKFGADEEVTLTHNHNTGLILGGTTPTLTIGDAGAEDAKILFDGNAVDYHIGLDDSADKLTIGKGSALGTTTALTIDENGIITAPLQPSFSVKPNAQQSNVAADNSQTVIQFNNEQFDTNGDYDTSNYRFTAPVTGIYQFNLTLRMDNLDASANYYSIFFSFPTGRFAPFLFDPNLASNSDVNIPYFPAVLALTIDLDANDTIDARIQQSNGTAETDIITDSFFSGFLVG